MDEKKKDLLLRLKTTQGHIGGIIKMIEEEKECLDILTQVSAIRASLGKIESSILELYLRKCLNQSLQEENKQEEIVEKLSKIFGRILK